MKSVLIIDDGVAIKQYCDQFLSMFFSFSHARYWDEAYRAINQNHPDIIILDKVFNIDKADLINPNKDKAKEGYYIAREIKERFPDLPIIMISLYDPIGTAELSLEFGIDDFIEWNALEIDREILKVKIQRLLSKSCNGYIKEIVRAFYDLGFVGYNKETINLMGEIKDIAANDSNVLLLGETGTGKDLVARIIHALSPRAKEEFAEINLSDLPENLVEDEIFGHEKGAYTDAKSEKISKLETVKNGTVLFNEIGD
ncbi:MAG: sigma 54-interacting transcriptional regulator, partial [bacterium]|nr:sigma 54-interacting transcriptional regulator [bacterium]